jgi:hypothetical protein
LLLEEVPREASIPDRGDNVARAVANRASIAERTGPMMRDTHLACR